MALLGFGYSVSILFGLLQFCQADVLGRVATDLNLHLPNTAKPINEQHAREMLNRTRVWLNCFNLDRSTGSQYGKPPIIPNTDYVANHSQDWWNSSEYNMKNFDIQICCYNAELRVMGNFVRKIYSDPNHPTGLNKVWCKTSSSWSTILMPKYIESEF